MIIKLVIAEHRREFRRIWEDFFHDVESVRVVNCGVADLKKMPELDAIMLPTVAALELFGGKPIMGKSQILSTKDKRDWPPFVVTLAPFPKGTFDNWVQELFSMFSCVLDAIEDFNENTSKAIRTLGFASDYVIALEKENVEPIHRAYMEFIGK